MFGGSVSYQGMSIGILIPIRVPAEQNRMLSVEHRTALKSPLKLVTEKL